MKDRHVGLMLVAVAALVGFLIWSYDNALTTIVNTTCTHGAACPMYATIDAQRNASYALAALVAVAGLYFVFFKKEEQLPAAPFERRSKAAADLSKLEGDEKTVASYIQEAGGSLYQSDLVAKTGFSKVRVTRILDKLEHDGVIERKRRGMTNIVVLR